MDFPRLLHPGDPEYQDLVACYVAQPGSMVDLVNGSIATPGGNASSRGRELGGIEAYFDGNGDSFTFGTTVRIAVGAPFTIVWESFLERIGSPNDAFPCVGTFARGVTNQPFRIVYSNDSAYDDIVVGYSDSGGNADAWLLPTGLPRIGVRHWGVWAYNGGTFATNTNHNMWVNGQPCTNSGTPGGLANITDTTILGKTGNLSTTDWFGGIRQVRLYTREWTESEAQRFADPATRDKLYELPRRRFYSLPPAGGDTTLAGAALAIATASGALSTQIPLQGTATAAATGSGALTAQILFAGSALAAAAASAALSTGISLAGAAQGQGVASATLTTQIRLVGAAAAAASAMAEFATDGAALQGTAAGAASASGALTTGIPLQGAAVVTASATGALAGDAAQLAGAAVAAATAAGTLTVQIRLTGAALAQAIAAGGLSTEIRLSGAAAGAASASGSLDGSAVLTVDPRYEAEDERDAFDVADPRGPFTAADERGLFAVMA